MISHNLTMFKHNKKDMLVLYIKIHSCHGADWRIDVLEDAFQHAREFSCAWQLGVIPGETRWL